MLLLLDIVGGDVQITLRHTRLAVAQPVAGHSVTGRIKPGIGCGSMVDRLAVCQGPSWAALDLFLYRPYSSGETLHGDRQCHVSRKKVPRRRANTCRRCWSARTA